MGSKDIAGLSLGTLEREIALAKPAMKACPNKRRR